jgi:hypothetical protein
MMLQVSSDAAPGQPVNIYRRFWNNVLPSFSVPGSPRTELASRDLLTLKMEAAWSSETSVTVYRCTFRNIQGRLIRR